MPIEHRNITDAERHEPKGASTASEYDTLVSDGATATSWKYPVRMGWWNLDDSATSSTPIALTLAATQYQLTNDTLGANTITTYKLPDITQIWNSSTNQLDFTELEIGDTVLIRADAEFTTSTNNTAITLTTELASGSGTPISLPFMETADIKTAGVHRKIIVMPLFIGSTLIKNNPATFYAEADKTGVTVEVNGWYIEVTKRNED